MTIETVVYCKCERSLGVIDINYDMSSYSDKISSVIKITVEPCPDCLEKEGESREQEGYDRGCEDTETKEG